MIFLSEILNEFLLVRKTAGKLKPNKKLSLVLTIKRTIKRRRKRPLPKPNQVNHGRSKWFSLETHPLVKRA